MYSFPIAESWNITFNSLLTWSATATARLCSTINSVNKEVTRVVRLSKSKRFHGQPDQAFVVADSVNRPKTVTTAPMVYRKFDVAQGLELFPIDA